MISHYASSARSMISSLEKTFVQDPEKNRYGDTNWETCLDDDTVDNMKILMNDRKKANDVYKKFIRKEDRTNEDKICSRCMEILHDQWNFLIVEEH